MKARAIILILLVPTLVIVLISHGTTRSLPLDAAQGELSSISSGSTIRVAPVYNGSQHFSVSGDGDVVVFMTNAEYYGGPPNKSGLIATLFKNNKQEKETRLLTYGTAFYGPAVSDNGRFVAFLGIRSDFLPAAENPATNDIFVYDLEQSSTELVSVSNGGTLADGNSRNPSISADGRFVAFDSIATNLDPKDGNNNYDVFVYDRVNDAINLVSISSTGEQGAGRSYSADLSPDGMVVAYHSDNDLAENDTNGITDTYVTELNADGTVKNTELVSVAWNGELGTNNSTGGPPAISADGRYVAFSSYAGNLVENDRNASRDVFVRDRLCEETSMVSVASDGQQGEHGGDNPSISDNGRFVTFTSLSNNLVDNDKNVCPKINTNNCPDVFVHDYLGDRTTYLVSEAIDGNAGDNASFTAHISANGRFVVFDSGAGNLVSDNPGVGGLFMHELPPADEAPPKVCTSSGDYSISGQIRDGNNDSISNATVFLDNGSTTSSDTNGQYEFNNLPAGIYSVAALFSGYSFYPDFSNVEVPPDQNDVDFVGTSNRVDTDGDGLLDDWEENGYDHDGDGDIDVDLPAEGANKNRKDIFVYVDWLGEDGFLGHDHHPDNALDDVIDAFANAPVANRDGSEGITLHIIFGQEAITENAQNIELGSVKDSCEYSWAEFDDLIKTEYFPEEYSPIFHYSVFAHDLPVFPCLGARPHGISRNGVGDSETGASDFIVALGDWEELSEFAFGVAKAGTFMHELGHNLGLGHGGLTVDSKDNVTGTDHTNYKPNHLSVMNYYFSTRGLRRRTTIGLFPIYYDGFLDYSRFDSSDLPDLDENNLDEESGLQGANSVIEYGTRYFCPNAEKIAFDGLQNPIDWNCDGDESDTTLSLDINNDDGARTTLSTVNEWENLVFNGGAIGAFGSIPELPQNTSMEDSPEITFEEDLQLGPFLHYSEIFLPFAAKHK